MRKALPGLLLALGLAAGAGLAGCSSDDSGSDEETTSSSTTPNESTEDGADAGAATGETPAEDGAAEGDADAGDGDKPSRDDVVAGYSSIITKESPVDLPADVVEDTATCLVDAIYNDVSAATLQALADENATGIDPTDAQAFADAGVSCAQAG